MPKKLTWKGMKPPQTAQQRIQYMTACQGWFAEISNQSSKLCPVHISPSPVEQTIVNHYVDYEASNFFSSSVFQCMACAELNCAVRYNSPHVVNPFSNWVILLCDSCKQKVDQSKQVVFG